MGKALRRGAEDGGVGRGAAARLLTRAARRVAAAALLPLLLVAFARHGALAQGLVAAPSEATRGERPGAQRVDAGRLTVVAYPEDAALARALLADAVARDSFPGLPRPSERVAVVIAPDRAAFRRLAGTDAPEWGAALAFPESHRVLMQGSGAGSDAGEPRAVLRHELAHMALHEYLGPLPPRWFDEGYASFAAGEWGRDEVLATNFALVAHISPTLDGLDAGFEGGATTADGTYALAYRAVADLAALDPDRGLSLFFRYWRDQRSFDRAVRAAYGITSEAFEQRWRAQTRRRYGAVALFADLTVGTILMLALIFPLWLVRRRRDRRRFDAMRAAEQEAERRAIAERAVIDALLADLARDGERDAGRDDGRDDGRDGGVPVSLDTPPGPV